MTAASFHFVPGHKKKYSSLNILVQSEQGDRRVMQYSIESILQKNQVVPKKDSVLNVDNFYKYIIHSKIITK